MAVRLVSGTNSFIGTSSTFSVALQPGTWGGWFKLLATPGNVDTYLSSLGNDAGTQWTMGLLADTAAVPSAYSYDGTPRKATGSKMRLGEWTHLMAVVGGVSTTLKLYQDGRQVGSTAFGTMAGVTTNRHKIGWTVNGIVQADAEYSDYAVWNAELSAAQVALLAQGASPLGIGTVPYLYLPLDAYALEDASPNNRAMAYVNMGVPARHPNPPVVLLRERDVAVDNVRTNLVYDSTYDIVNRAAPVRALQPIRTQNGSSGPFSSAAYYGAGDTAKTDITGTGLTMFAWCYLTANTGDYTILNKGGTTATTIAYRLYATASSYRIAIGDASGTDAMASNSAPAVNRWQAVCATYDGAALRLFFDGVLDRVSGLTTRSIQNIANQLYIGTDEPGTLVWTAGQLAHCAIWDQALSYQEIALLGRGANPLDFRRTALRGYWPLGKYRFADLAGNNGLSATGTPVPISGNDPWINEPQGSYAQSFVGYDGVVPAIIDTATVLVDLQVTGAEVGAALDSATVLVDIQPSGTDGIQRLDAATVYMDIQPSHCEVFTAQPAPSFIFSEYTQWSMAASTQWSENAMSQWQWTARLVGSEGEEICL